jgi:hypothetical protein
MGSDPQSYLDHLHEAGMVDAHKAFEDLFGDQMVGKSFQQKVAMARQILDAMIEERKTLEADRDRFFDTMRAIAVDGLGLTDPWEVPDDAPPPKDWQEFPLMSQAVKKLRDERDEAIKSQKFTQEWYGSRWQRMSEWFRTPEMKDTKAAHDWFSIVANGGLLGPEEPPVSFMARVNMTRFECERLRKENKALKDAVASALKDIDEVLA